ncbi:hypothetical protein, partial [Klebsiella pneumoniae]|uniref:hypothetical protein n=1 Tax=Klebsiella pneumoniae TaxID=573 RepID=UPI002731208E
MAGKIELATAPLLAAMTVAEGKAKDELRLIIERLTGAIIDQDNAQKEAARKDVVGDQNREITARVALINVETRY